VTYQPGTNYPPVLNNGFIVNYAESAATDPTKIMKCFSPERVPVIKALAQEFAVCDNWFSSMPGPTWPNRFFMHAASSGGLDDSPSGLASFGNLAFNGYTFENGTIFDLLDGHCIEWRVFAGDSFPVTLAISGMTIAELEGRIHDFDDFVDAVNDPNYSAAYTFIEPNYGNDLGAPIDSGDFTCGNSQHPLDDVTRGERLIKTVYETIRNSPHWNNSLLLITWDEHGGFYDHVNPPGAAAPGDPISDEDNNHHSFLFNQLGVRVPAVVVSPLIPRGLVDGTTYDHTSLLATIENILGLPPLTRRDAAANSLNHLLSLSTPRTDAPSELPEPAVSGFTCDDDPPLPSAMHLSDEALLAAEGNAWQFDRESLTPSTLRGFQEVALLKAMSTARGRDRQQIRQEYLAVRTRGAARHFMRKVAIMARHIRLPATVRSKGLISPRMFLKPPRRQWQSEPLQSYRRPDAPSEGSPL
jgi:hypothetical protein